MLLSTLSLWSSRTSRRLLQGRCNNCKQSIIDNRYGGTQDVLLNFPGMSAELSTLPKPWRMLLQTVFLWIPIWLRRLLQGSLRQVTRKPNSSTSFRKGNSVTGSCAIIYRCVRRIIKNAAAARSAALTFVSLNQSITTRDFARNSRN